jgi:CO/xanthine dehydrogenase Mo-binding subunit
MTMSASEETEETTLDIYGATLTRSRFVKGAGAMVVGLSFVGAGAGAKAANADVFGSSTGPASVPLLPGMAHSLDPSNPGSWFTINADNTIVMRTGIPEMGQGSASTAFAQIAADELNVPYSAITQVIIGDTDRTVGGGIGAGYMSLGAPNIRKVAAYIYQTLLSMASTQLGVPVTSLTVTNGVISGGGKQATYGQLVAGKGLNLTIPVAGDPTSFLGATVTGNPPVKPISAYQVVGQSIPMRTIPGIVTGSATYVGDVRLPGMLHARIVHPNALGANLISVGTLDKKQFPNTQIVVKGNLVGVVDPQEYIAIQGASLLAAKTKWTSWAGLPASGNLFGAMRKLDWTSTPASLGANVGNPNAALASAATKLSATYEYPTEKHAPIGPTAAVGDVRADGTIYVHMHGQNPGALRGEIALMMNTSLDKVIVRWYDGSGHYGRSNGGNSGAEEEAVILSSIVGKPVRVQWMRWDDMQWSTQHPPVLSDVQAGLDANGKLVSFKADFYEPAGQDDRPVGALLAGLPTMAAPAIVPPAGSFSGTSNGISDPWVYDQVANVLQTGHGTFNIGGGKPSDPTYNQEIGLRGHSMRTPGQRQQNFAQESMINELAAAAKVDPIQFRLNNTSAARLIAVLDELRTASGWETRPSPSPKAATTGSTPIIGQGCSQMLRSGAYWACAVQVSVVPKTGKVSVTKLTTVVDPGVVVNPLQLQRMAEGGATMGVSETLHEQVTFNTGGITNHDWVTFPILRMTELPDITVKIISNPSVGAMGGGGEGPNGFVAAAIASAVFDATGKQPRRLPLVPGNIRALLAT